MSDPRQRILDWQEATPDELPDDAIDAMIDRELLRIRESYESGTASNYPCAFLAGRNGDVMLAMPGLNDLESRLVVKEAALKEAATVAVVSMEVWYVSIKPDWPKDLIQRVTAAHEAGELDRLEPGLRRERVQVYIETKDVPVRLFAADITRENERAILGPWEELKLRLPRPGFKRYLREEGR